MSARLHPAPRSTAAGKPGDRPPGRRHRVPTDAVRGVAGVAVFLALAELAGRAGLVDRKVLPLASAVLERAAGLAADDVFLDHVATTLTGWSFGLLLTVLIAVPLGLLIGSIPAVDAAVRPFVEFLRPIPSVAIIPLAISLFPDALDRQLAVICFGASWPVLLNTVYGLREVDPVAKETLRSFGFSPLSVLWRVSLPTCAPFIATGVRIASGIALILAISTELLAGGSSGIGVYLIEAGGSTDGIEMIIAATVWAGAFGVLFDLLFTRAEGRLFRWRRQSLKGAGE
ncbi:ABC transporter permease [Spirillospora sp. CA-294931]|uniref:ABC transporter permease n=1 Tax=Spirillospora sp. CA-294931 TaxID=3240042 RepID=UPI003D8C8E9E